MKQTFQKLLIAIAGLLVSHWAYASDFIVDEIHYDILSSENRTVKVVKSNSYTGKISIPKKIIYGSITYSVTSIGNEAFYSCKGLTEVTIPNSVTSIGDKAFYDCSGLTSVTIQNEQLEIGESAFNYCNGLNKVNISDIKAWCNIYFHSSTSNPLLYAKNLYLNDTKITDLVIPNSVTSIGNYAFYNCSGLTSVTIPNSITSIGDWAFGFCSGLTSVTIQNEQLKIGTNAFGHCYGLNKVNISDIKAWCNINFDSHASNPLCFATNLYLNDTKITDLVIPNSVTSIGHAAFYNCKGLTSVTIPNSVTSIGSSAFYACKGLTSVTIPNSVTWIGNEAFSACNGLTSVTIPNSVTSIGYMTFYACNGLTSVTIPNSVTSIGYMAFSACKGLTSVTIPNSVTSIGDMAFSGCNGLNKVNISDIKAWCNINFDNSTCNPLYYAKNLYLNDTKITDLVIPNSVTSIGEYAFYGCDLTSVTIQNEQLKIGSNAFASNNCNNILCSSKTPPTECNISAFSNSMLMYSTLNIPLGTKSAYESVDPWRNFWNIVEKDFSDVEEIIIEESEYISVCINGGEIVINNALNCDVTVYSLTGQPIYCNNEYDGESISLSKGIYIVKAGGKTRKVII